MIADPRSLSQKNFARPLIGAVLGYIGGILLLLGTLAAFVYFGSFSESLLGIPLVAILFLGLGLMIPILILLSSSMLYNRPEEHFVWGWLILFLGIIGFGPWNFFGMYAIGSTLSIAGGFYGLAFQPQKASAAKVAEPDTTPLSFLKNCIHCGASIPIAAETCSLCGKPQKRI